TDQSNAVVRGATVDIVDVGTNKSVRTVTTGDEGRFGASLLPPGAYRLEVSAANFKKAVVSGVKVEISGTVRQDVTLEAGKIEETVNVEATPTLINTENSTTGQALDAQTLRTLPLASPNFLFLLSLSSGVTGDPTDVRAAGRGTADVTVNGQRTSNNSVSLNGINVNEFNLAHFDTVPLPNPDTLKEMKVATSLYDASQGSKGGGALGLVTASGTKDIHFDLYWNHRNDALNANEWFRNAKGLSKNARLLQNVFGGSASGPVPKAGGFWFFNYQGVRARNGIDPNGSSLSPTVQKFTVNADGTTTAAQLAADYGLFPAQIDPVAVKILNMTDTRFGGSFLVPRFGQGGCVSALAGVGASNPGTFTCQFSAVAPILDNQHTVSYDRGFRDGKDKILGTWFWDEGSVAKPFGTDTNLGNPRTDTQFNRFLSITETHIFSPTKVNELRLGFSRFLFANLPTDVHTLAEVGAQRGNSSQFPGLYRVGVTGSISLGTGVNDDRGTVSNQYNVVETFSWIRGRHSFRMGGEGVQYQLNRFNNFAVRGALTFGSTGTQSLAAANCKNDTNDCTAFQNFLRGRVTAVQSAFGDPARNFIATDYAGFFQDDYRFSPKLTINLGLRWEAMSFGHDKLNRAGVFDPALAAAGKNPFLFPEAVDIAGFKGTPGVPKCALIRCRDDNNFAPRVGFAWDVRGDQKTVLRAGYGIYYQRLSNQNILQNSLAAPFTVQPLSNDANPVSGQLQNPLASIPPPSILAAAYIPQATRFAGLFNATSSTVNGVPSNGISTNPADVNNPAFKPIFVNELGQRCLGYASTNTNLGATNCSINLASFTTAPRDAYTPYTQQWNFTVQRELMNGWALEVGYVGSHYTGGIGIWDPFIATLVGPSTPKTLTDINGVTYTITTNTVNNEELRHQIVGLSRKKGARYSGNIGQGRYDSLQATLSRRLHRGLYFQAAYTYSRNMDNVSGSLSTDELNATRAGQNGANIYNDQSNPRQNRARGDFDRPNRLVVSYSYDLPVPRSNFFNNQVFKGWTVSGIVTYQSGLPFSVTDSTSGGLFGTTLGTATALCTPKLSYTSGSTTARLAHYLDPACFTTAATPPNSAGAGATGWGTSPRNGYRGPRQSNWDLSLIKAFHLGERNNFQFRTDIFNLFNHPIFASPSSVNIGTVSSFTQITETRVPARLIQFGLRYSF
ncbi:MAG: carboxypeptidase-like regulatory domain-containing protein, partial [Pyrinomonadaceae bacterium]